MSELREQVQSALNNGVTRQEVHRKVDEAVKQQTDKVIAWMKGILFLMACIAILLPSIGLTVLMLAWAWTLVRG